MIRYFFALCALLLFHGGVSIHAATLHVVIAADTESNVGSGIRADLHLFNEELRRIAKYTGLALEQKTFSGHDFDPVIVLDYLRALDVKSNDVVIYYHSSHGFRTSQMHRAWPALDFGVKPAIDFADIVHIIKAKPQRFAVVLADCCNNSIPDWAIPNFYHKDLRPSWQVGKHRAYNYQTLFLKQRGMIVAAAASPGQYAWIDLNFGGFFTTSFLANLQQLCDQKTGGVQWTDVLIQTKAAVRELCIDCEHLQDLIYEIDLE